MTEKMNLAQLWNDIVAARKEVGNRLCQAFDESLKKNGPREFYVLDESTGMELWSTCIYAYPSRTGTRPLITFPVVENVKNEVASASIRERKIDRDVVIRVTSLSVGDQGGVRMTGDTEDEELYTVLLKAERGLFNILWPEVDDD